MADEEEAVCDVVERAMAETSAPTPMELLLSDSSRANLDRVAASPAADGPGCPVKSPFSLRGGATRQRRRVRVQRGAERVPEAARPPGRPLLGRVRARQLHGALARRAALDRPRRRPAHRREDRAADDPGGSGGRAHRHRPRVREDPAAGLHGRAHRPGQPPHAREGVRAVLSSGAAPFALAIADLDNFKHLNDTHGHETGDRALRLFAQVAQHTLRDHDAIARWGGEEFVVALPGVSTASEAIADPRPLARAASRRAPGRNPTLHRQLRRHRLDPGQRRWRSCSRSPTAACTRRSTPAATAPASATPPTSPNVPARTAESIPVPAARRGARPSLHEATDEEEPHPNGVEIR